MDKVTVFKGKQGRKGSFIMIAAHSLLEVSKILRDNGQKVPYSYILKHWEKASLLEPNYTTAISSPRKIIPIVESVCID